MGIYINGMEMPTKPGAYSLKIRLFVREDGTASIWGLEEYISHEPLDVIPVPKHGRLISANLLKADFTGNFIETYPTALVHAMIDEAPTIIPAEEGE